MLAGSLRAAAVGVSVGEATRVRVIATTKGGDHPRAARDAARRLIELAAEAAVADGEAHPLDGFGAELAKRVTVDHAGERVTITATAGGNVLKLLLATFRGPD